jgi:hypothetical protein
MNYWMILLKFGPTIYALVQSVVHALPDSSGKERAEAVIATLMKVEGIAADAAPAVAKAVQAGYTLLKSAKKVDPPAAATAAPAA